MVCTRRRSICCAGPVNKNRRQVRVRRDYTALSVLVFGGQTTLGRLAAAEQVKPPTMSRIVAGLKHSGLVHIEADMRDARRVQIAATAKGVRLLQKARQRRIAHLAKQLGRLRSEDLRALAKAVQVLEKTIRDWR